MEERDAPGALCRPGGESEPVTVRFLQRTAFGGSRIRCAFDAKGPGAQDAPGPDILQPE